MPEFHDPRAIVRHAADVGDWRLVELLGRLLTRGAHTQQRAARRAYVTLAVKLGLVDDSREMG
jgi:hypothetical protein